MLFRETPLLGARLIELEKRRDERGFFARFFCERELQNAGLENRFVQLNTSFSAKRGTLRGIHYQLAPVAEVKIVRCVRGAFYDVIVDMRPDSPTFGGSFGAELNADNRSMMYVPRGFAHAMLSLADDTEALYLVSEFYAPDKERGIRWNDPRFKIEWPIAPTEISAKDAAWPEFDAAYHGVEQLAGLV